MQPQLERAGLALRESQAGPTICLTIEDNGVGMTPQQLDRLFQPFFTTKPNGTGLGLAITRGIVRGHRGEIRVRSRSGFGTVFDLVFPALGAMST